MPSLSSPTDTLVLVTGANGYVAAHVVRELLEHGYRVRGTVRALSKAAHLQDIFRQYGDKLEFVVINDMMNDGAFDEAVKGVDALIHIAAAVHYNFKDPQDAIVPAVKGTTGIINSVLKHGASVKRIVITSSGATVVRNDPEPLLFTEENWNQQAVDEVEREDSNASPMSMYRASKTLAERAAWDLYNAHKKDGQWDLVSIIPNWVFGPIIHEAADPNSLNTSTQAMFNAVVKGTKSEKELLTGSGWIDVRDLATAHRLTLEKAEAGGERIIVNQGSWFWQDWIDAANCVVSSYKTLPRGVPGAQKGLPHKLSFDASKAARVLGLGCEIPYRDMKATIHDTLEDFAARGWGLNS